MIRNIIVFLVCAMIAETSTLMINRSQRSTDTCGVAKNNLGLIVRGKSFPRGSFPWIVALMHTGWTPPPFFCGGTLISKTFVISAAHCILGKHAPEKFLPRDILAMFGAHDLSNSFEAGRILQSPKNIFIHDDWNHLIESYDADVSLLEFETNINFDVYIQPICLWYSENEQTVTEGIVTGWGQSEDPAKNHENEPKLVKAPIQNNEDCFLDAKKLLDLSSRRTFCAGLRNGSGVCQGDSGGGFFIKMDEVFYLKGIVSSSLIKNDGCDVSNNAVYTNVVKFRDWIEKITGIVMKVLCTFKTMDSWCCGNLKTCIISQTIDNEENVFGFDRDVTIEQFHIGEIKDVKFLPRNIGEKFPNLKELWAKSCKLTIVRVYYFKGMENLQLLNLYDNKIATIESAAFKDLISLKGLDLRYNMIETIDQNLFATMVNLEVLYLNNNKIKFLSPTTFKIPGGKIEFVSLESNACIGGSYYTKDLDQLEANIRANCTQ